MVKIVNVGLDAGHGGKHPGATRPWFPQTEAEYNLALCREILSAIRLSGWPINPVLIRTRDDETMGLWERGEKSLHCGCDFVLSVHVNACSDPTASGGLLFHWPDNPIGESVGNVMARSIPQTLYRSRRASIPATDDPTPDDDWLERPRAVMEVHRATTVLLETAFMSNRVDAEEIQKDEIKRGLVACVMVGLAELLRWHV